MISRRIRISRSAIWIFIASPIFSATFHPRPRPARARDARPRSRDGRGARDGASVVPDDDGDDDDAVVERTRATNDAIRDDARGALDRRGGARARDADATPSATRASASSTDARAIVDGAEGVPGPPERERDDDGR